MSKNKNENGLFGKFTRWSNTISKSIADKLNDQINPLSVKAKKRIFLVIGVLMSVICFGLIFQSLQNEETSALSIDSVSTPKDVFNYDFKPERDLIDEYNRMVRYKELFDQLKFHPRRQFILDSLKKVYPGLSDSVKSFTENYYSH